MPHEQQVVNCNGILCSIKNCFFLLIKMRTLVYSVATHACMVAIYGDTNIVESEYDRSMPAGGSHYFR